MSSHWKRAEFAQGQNWPVIYWCGSLNLTVGKGFHSMPAMECGLGGPNVACGDAVSKYLHYTRLYFRVMGCRTWEVSTKVQRRVVYNIHTYASFQSGQAIWIRCFLKVSLPKMVTFHEIWFIFSSLIEISKQFFLPCLFKKCFNANYIISDYIQLYIFIYSQIYAITWPQRIWYMKA